MTFRLTIALAAWVGLASVSACNRGPDAETLRRLNEANDKVVACKREVNDLKQEVAVLKRQLAEALANPNRMQLTDPEIINLIASIREEKGLSGDVKPTLDPKEASRVVFQGARAMQACYERALRKNQALQMRTGIGMTLAITVKPVGTVEDVEVAPSVDGQMTDCIKTAAMRWKFPAFQGEAIVITQKVTLTPKS